MLIVLLYIYIVFRQVLTRFKRLENTIVTVVNIFIMPDSLKDDFIDIILSHNNTAK